MVAAPDAPRIHAPPSRGTGRSRGPVDAIVIGAGHNGLVAAAELAAAHWRVLVLEARATVGGIATTEEFHPGFHASPLVPACAPLPAPVVEGVGLGGGVPELLPIDPVVAGILPEGGLLPLWRDVGKTQGALAPRSRRDAERFPVFREAMLAYAALLRPLLLGPPPDPLAGAPIEGLRLLNLLRKARRLGRGQYHGALRLPALSVHDYLAEWFEDPALLALLEADALRGLLQGPRSPGTALGLVRHHLALLDGGAWSFVRGGSGALARALAQAAEARGAVIRTGAEVARILTADGGVSGVELTTGERIACGVIASSADPQRTLLRLVDPLDLDPRFRQRVRHLDLEGSLSVVNLALGGRPSLGTRGGPTPWPPHLRVAPDPDYLERAHDAAKYGGLPEELVLDAYMPSLVDADLAPPGKEVLTIHVPYTPYRLRKGSWEDWRGELGDRVLATLAAHAPDLRALVLHRTVMTPVDLERGYGLTGGHVDQGEMALAQAFFLRPLPGWSRYRTPLRGLYLCGAGAHPGGGITGLPGHNAAREILRDGRRAVG